MRRARPYSFASCVESGTSRWIVFGNERSVPPTLIVPIGQVNRERVGDWIAELPLCVDRYLGESLFGGKGEARAESASALRRLLMVIQNCLVLYECCERSTL